MHENGAFNIKPLAYLAYVHNSAQVSSIRDCNIPWFADLLLSMLLHYGTNLPGSGGGSARARAEAPADAAAPTIAGASSAPAKKPIEPVSARPAAAKTASVNAAPTSSSATLSAGSVSVGFGASSAGPPPPPGLSKGGARQRLLEARMGIGGIGSSTSGGPSIGAARSAAAPTSAGQRSASRPAPHNSATPETSPHFKWMLSALDQLSALFPGNQQFFFRFIAFCDNFRFAENFSVLLLAEINKIVSATVDTPSPDLFAISVCKLCVIGRFLGYLQCWPQWVLSVSADVIESGPLRSAVEKSFSDRQSPLAASKRVQVHNAVMNATREKQLSLMLPWIIEYLKVLLWDSQTRQALVSGLKSGPGTGYSSVQQSPKVSLTRNAGPGSGGKSLTSDGVSPDKATELQCIQMLLSLLVSYRGLLELSGMTTNKYVSPHAIIVLKMIFVMCLVLLGCLSSSY
jgi:hypothetical protein